MDSLNKLGDTLIHTTTGHGSDIAAQRMDDLDTAALQLVEELVKAGQSTVVADVACGSGAHAIRMHRAGAAVFAVDLMKTPAAIEAAQEAMRKAADPHLKELTFVAGDMRNFGGISKGWHFDAIYSQRAIHYLSYADAREVIGQFRWRMKHGAKLFISASGLNTELGQGYEGKQFRVGARYHRLAQEMGIKHGITERVCLYTIEDMAALLQSEGFKILSNKYSEFGNVKTIAVNP